MERPVVNKKLLLIAGVAMASIGISTSAIAAQTTGSATATVLAPITIANASALEFGDIDVTGGGTITISAAGVSSGSLTSVGTQSAGTFNLTGQSGATFSVVIAKVTDLLNGANDLVLSAFTHDAGPTPTMIGGAITLGVGATITADGSEPAGAYAATYTVDVDYN